jgi:hypothetical protein
MGWREGGSGEILRSSSDIEVDSLSLVGGRDLTSS